MRAVSKGRVGRGEGKGLRGFEVVYGFHGVDVDIEEVHVDVTLVGGHL